MQGVNPRRVPTQRHPDPSRMQPDTDSTVASVPAVVVGAAGVSWYVAATKTDHERRVAADLAGLGVETFVPTERRRHEYPSGRVETRTVALWSGYCLFNGNGDARDCAARHKATLAVLPVLDQLRLADEVAAVRRSIAAGLTLNAYRGLTLGTACRVIGGPLLGTVGKLVRRTDGRGVFTIEVAMLGRAVVDVAPELLEAAA